MQTKGGLGQMPAILLVQEVRGKPLLLQPHAEAFFARFGIEHQI